jgi:hypothetical protein
MVIDLDFVYETNDTLKFNSEKIKSTLSLSLSQDDNSKCKHKNFSCGILIGPKLMIF